MGNSTAYVVFPANPHFGAHPLLGKYLRVPGPSNRYTAVPCRGNPTSPHPAAASPLAASRDGQVYDACRLILPAS